MQEAEMEDKDEDDARLHIFVPVSPDNNGELIKSCTPYTPFPFHDIFLELAIVGK